MISGAYQHRRVRDVLSFFSASPLMLARLTGAGAGFVTQLILARLLSPEDLGVFFAVTSFAALTGLMVTQGYPGVTQRFITRYREQRRKRLLDGFVAQTWREGLAVTLVACVAVATVGLAWPGVSCDTRLVFEGGAFCIAAASSLNMCNAFASVERRFALGQLPETLIRPVLFLPAVWVAAILGIRATAGSVTLLFAALSGVLALTQYALLSPRIPPARRLHARLTRRWRQEGRTLALGILFATMFADLAILFASPFLGAAGLAPFGIALKISLLIGFAVQIAHQITLPDLAEAHERRDARRLVSSLLHATVFPSVVTGVCLLASAVAGEHLLMLFGPQYVVAKWPLVVLLAAQFLRAIAGPGQSLLTLKGAQLTNAAICVVCCAVLLIANAALIPVFGLLGASFAVLITVAVWAGASCYMLWRNDAARVDLPFLMRAVRV